MQTEAITDSWSHTCVGLQRTREVMGAAGLPTPKNTIIRSPKDLAKAAAHVGFPAVLKPISGAASLGVIRVNSEPDLHKWAPPRLLTCLPAC